MIDQAATPGLSDAVVIALITGITTTLTTIVSAVLTYLTRRQVKKLRAEVADESEQVRAYCASYLEMAARHPEDLPPVSVPHGGGRRGGGRHADA